MKTLTIKGIFFCMLLFPAVSLADQESAAEDLFRQAKAPGVTAQERVTLLQQSVDTALSYQAFFELGRAYNELGEADRAIKAFEQAAAVTTDPAQHAKALGIIGRLQAAAGNNTAAGLVIKRSLKEKYDPALAKELMTLEKQRGAVVSATEIGRTLSKGLAMRSIGVAASVDLRVGFEFKSAKLDARGKAQVEEIAKALADPQFDGRPLRLVGHTDRRGEDTYNDNLSLKRAEAVKSYLVAKLGMAADRFQVEGKGKREPIFFEETDDAFTMNRRVELVLE